MYMYMYIFVYSGQVHGKGVEPKGEGRICCGKLTTHLVAFVGETV